MAKISDMSLEERETHLSISGDVRAGGGDWEMFTDDPVMIRQMEKLGFVCVRTTAGGGRYYLVPQNQITLRKKRELSDERREELASRARQNFGRQSPAPGVEEEGGVEVRSGKSELESYAEEQDYGEEIELEQNDLEGDEGWGG